MDHFSWIFFAFAHNKWLTNRKVMQKQAMAKHFHIVQNHIFTRTAKRSISIRFSYMNQKRGKQATGKKWVRQFYLTWKTFGLCDRKITQNKVINYKAIAKMNAKMRSQEPNICHMLHHIHFDRPQCSCLGLWTIDVQLK